MIVPRWVIGCEYITLQTLFRLLRLLGRWLGSTILIKLMYAKTQSVFQVLTYVLNKSLEKNKNLELYSPGGICHLCRDIREEVQHCSCDGALKCGFYCEECQLDMPALEKCECEKAAVYDLLRTGMVGGPAQVFTRYHEKDITHKISCVWRKEQVDKGCHRLSCKCLISLLFGWCNALWQRHADCE